MAGHYSLIGLLVDNQDLVDVSLNMRNVPLFIEHACISAVRVLCDNVLSLYINFLLPYITPGSLKHVL